MSNNLSKSALIVMVLATAIATQANAQTRHCHDRRSGTATSPRVIYKVVQDTPQYSPNRPEVVSGSRVTLFANFLRQESGYVMFNLNGTSTACKLVQWKPNSVTVELPRLGLLSPQNAVLQIVLPNGRIAKSFKVLFVAQPDIVIHANTIPRPMPPAPCSQGAVYATPVHGGLMLRSAGSK